MVRASIPAALALLFTVAHGASAQQFGGPLAIGGDRIFVSEASQSALPGIVYVFADRDGGWTEIDQIAVASEGEPPDGFGRALATSSGWLFVGAPMEDGGAGAAYVFSSDGDAWRQIARLAPEGLGEEAGFGSAVVSIGDLIVIGAGGGDSGVVYVYGRDGNAWTERSRIDPAADAGIAGFGRRLAVEGDVLLVAAPDGDPASVVAYHLAADGGVTPAGSLTSEGLGERSGFGSSIGLHQGRAYVGASGFGGRVGAVYQFGPTEDDEQGWEVLTRLGPFETTPGTRFGASIGFDGSTVVVGAPGSAGGTGALYSFDLDSEGVPTGATRLLGQDLGERAGFASSTILAGDLSVVGATGVDQAAGAAVVFARNDSGGWTERGVVVNEPRGFSSITGGEVECEDSRAGIFECEEVNITSFLSIQDIGGGRGTRINDIWGWTDAETGREYALVGRTDGTSFVDISDPYDPRYLGDLPKTEGSRSIIWRDIKVYADHAYVVADGAGEHGVQVFDLRQLRDVGDESVIFEETFLYEGIHSAHNIVINEETGFAYAVGSSGGGETCGGGYHMLDLEDPARPTFAGCFADPKSGRRLTGYSHDAQCVVYHGPDTEHVGREICLGSNETMLNIADVTDKDAAISLANVSYPNVAYAHQGWLTEDHRYFYMNDEGDEPQGLVEGTRTLVWDVTDLDDPILVKEYIAETSDTDHNLYVVGDLMYQSNYGAGLRILDISEPENPVEVAFFDNSPFEGGASWSNYPFFKSGIIAVTGMNDGLFLLKNTARRLVP